MLTSIHIQGFKGFRDTKIPELRRVNLIVGGQNVGKTSLLEAIYAATNSRAQIHQVAMAFRQTEANDATRFIASAFDKEFVGIEANFDSTSMRIQKTGTDLAIGFNRQLETGGFLWSGTTNWIDDPKLKAVPVPVHLPNQGVQTKLFGQAVFSLKKMILIEMLRKIDSRLKDLNEGSPDGETRIYAEIEGAKKAVSMSQLGHGFNRLLYLFSNLLATDSKLVLIDEIENGIHYSALPTVFTGIKNIAQDDEGVQSIITTHSKECIRAACEAFKDSPDDFQVVRLVRKDDNIVAHIIPYEYVEATLEMHGELR